MKELDPKTPRWFQTFYERHFRPVKSRSKRNERWSWVILGVIVTGQLTNHWHAEIWEFTRHLFGM
jgi:hypothetical protein